MDWRCGSGGSVPALQAQNPEFKPQSHQKKKKKIKTKTHTEDKGKMIKGDKENTHTHTHTQKPQNFKTDSSTEMMEAKR
jgi:hypothetical protein